MPELAGGRTEGFRTANNHVLGYQRIYTRGNILCLVNFSDCIERVEREQLSELPAEVQDIITGRMINIRNEGVQLQAQQYVWLKYSAEG